MKIFNLTSEHFKKTIGGHFEKIDRTDYRVEVSHSDKAIHITGRCSDDDDWPDNFDFRQRPVKWFPDSDILVHAGFLRQYKSTRSKLLDICYEYPGYSIYVDGFSLGASWTQIFLQDVLHRWPDRDVLAILYAPGNPWRKLPKKYKDALKRCTYFVRSIWDPVTWMGLLRFYRYGKHITLGKWYRILPLQHTPDQIIRGLKERGGK